MDRRAQLEPKVDECKPLADGRFGVDAVTDLLTAGTGAAAVDPGQRLALVPVSAQLEL